VSVGIIISQLHGLVCIPDGHLQQVIFITSLLLQLTFDIWIFQSLYLMIAVNTT